jgi:hypothetical protein
LTPVRIPTAPFIGVAAESPASLDCFGDSVMLLLVYYVAFVLVGTAVAATIGVWLDPFSQIVSLTVFFILFFGLLWGAWVLSVRLTEPAEGPQAAE